MFTIRKCMPIILLNCQILLTYKRMKCGPGKFNCIKMWHTKCTIITNLSSTFIQASFCNDCALINGYEDGKPVKGNAHQVRGAGRGSVLCDLVPAEADVRSCGARTRAARNDVVVVATILRRCIVIVMSRSTKQAGKANNSLYVIVFQTSPLDLKHFELLS